MSKLITLLAACLLLAACGDDRGAPVDSRLIIVGFDGMDPNLAQRWMDDGSLPNFSKLAARGSFAPLATSNPPQSPVAWSSFATGTGPGDHGIYDFLRRDAATHNPAFSISESTPPENVLKLFGMELPLDSGQLINRRQGTPFWADVEAEGGSTTVLRVPVTFPPDDIHRMMAGMGVPDLLGTQGTYTFYSTQPASNYMTSSTRAVRLRPNRDGRMETSLDGPPHPLRPAEGNLSVPLVMEPAGEGRAQISLGDTTIELAEGEWSEWITVNFEYLGPAAVSGIVRLNLVRGYPRVQLYVSPINIDPREPVVPLSSPASYAARLAEDHGLYHTIGMPEETWSLNEGHIPDSAYLDMIRATMGDREMMFYDALDANDSNVVVGVFVQTDRVSHMFYRGLDTEHPLYPETTEEARQAIHWIYTEADRILGETMNRMGPNDRLMVVSDHGFAPFRRAVHLNRYLANAGYLVFKDAKTGSGVGFSDVDWSRTEAYALGLNSIFINRAGREAFGIVDAQRADIIKAEIQADLPQLRDPVSQASMVREGI